MDRILTGQLKDIDVYRPFALGQRADILRGKFGNGKLVAVKVLRVLSYGNPLVQQELREKLEGKLERWGSLDNPNVAPFLGLTYDAPFPVGLVLAYYANGNVMDYTKANPTANKADLIRGIAKGILYLHTRSPPVIHGDLRGCNVLIDDNGIAQLVDFELGSVLNGADFTTTNIVGPARWQSPEMFMTEEDDEELPLSIPADVYSFAMLGLEIITGEPPFNHRKYDTVVILDVMKGRRPRKPDINTLAQVFWPVFERAWAQNAAVRPNMSTICQDLDGLR